MQCLYCIILFCTFPEHFTSKYTDFPIKTIREELATYTLSYETQPIPSSPHLSLRNRWPEDEQVSKRRPPSVTSNNRYCYQLFSAWHANQAQIAPAHRIPSGHFVALFNARVGWKKISNWWQRHTSMETYWVEVLCLQLSEKQCPKWKLSVNFMEWIKGRLLPLYLC